MTPEEREQDAELQRTAVTTTTSIPKDNWVEKVVAEFEKLGSEIVALWDKGQSKDFAQKMNELLDKIPATLTAHNKQIREAILGLEKKIEMVKVTPSNITTITETIIHNNAIESVLSLLEE